MISITTHCTRYAPFEDGADEREPLGTDTAVLDFDNAAQAAEWLRRNGLQSPSDSRSDGYRTWLNDVDAYEHPYTGVLEERSAHPYRVHPRVWAAIVEAVRWPGH